MKYLLWFPALLFSGALLAQRPDYYRILAGERESLQCRMDLMRRAEREILLSTYAIDPDVVGLATLARLAEAAGRGVKVQVLLDDFGSHLDPCLLRYLGERGVSVRVYHKFSLLRLGKTNKRMHGKMLITDRRHLLVGGRNLKDEYYTLDTVSNFLDREVLVAADSAAAQAAAHFATLWQNPKLTERKTDPLTDEQRRCWQTAMARAPDTLQQRLRMAVFGRRDWLAGLKPAAGRVQFIHDNFVNEVVTGPRKDLRSTRQLIDLVEQAGRTIDIENSYFLPPRPWRRAFRNAIKRGVKIRVLTNSSYTTDVPLVQAVYRLRRARYERMGLELWEYRGAKMLHTKAIVIDGVRTTIGSYNLDRQSFKNNTEVGVWVDDKPAAAQHKQLMDRVLQQSRAVGEAVPPNLPPPSKIQRKRHRLGQIFRWTLAPLVGWIF